MFSCGRPTSLTFLIRHWSMMISSGHIISSPLAPINCLIFLWSTVKIHVTFSVLVRLILDLNMSYFFCKNFWENQTHFWTFSHFCSQRFTNVWPTILTFTFVFRNVTWKCWCYIWSHVYPLFQQESCQFPYDVRNCLFTQTYDVFFFTGQLIRISRRHGF